MEDHALAAAEIERRIRKDRIVLGCAVLFCFAAVFLMVWLAVRAIRESMVSPSNVLAVASALTQYRIDHDGKSPQRLSDLYPGYLNTTAPFFDLNQEAAQKVDRMAGSQPQRDLIDAFATCRFLVLPDGRAIVMEPLTADKPGRVIYVILDSYQLGIKVYMPPTHNETREAFVQLVARQFAEPSAPSQ